MSLLGRPALLIALLGLLAGCGGCGGKNDHPDGGVPDDRPDVPTDARPDSLFPDAHFDGGPDGPSLELGTGSRMFIPVHDGDLLQLARGCQGGQHIWTALRVHNINPRSAIVQLQLVRLPDGTPIECRMDHPEDCRPLENCNIWCINSYPFQVRTTFDELDGGVGQIVGLTLQTPDPDALLDTEVLMRARVVDRMMVTVTAEHRIRVEWGPERCGSMRDGSVPEGGPGDGGTIDAAALDGGPASPDGG